MGVHKLVLFLLLMSTIYVCHGQDFNYQFTTTDDYYLMRHGDVITADTFRISHTLIKNGNYIEIKNNKFEDFDDFSVYSEVNYIGNNTNNELVYELRVKNLGDMHMLINVASRTIKIINSFGLLAVYGDENQITIIQDEYYNPPNHDNTR